MLYKNYSKWYDYLLTKTLLGIEIDCDCDMNSTWRMGAEMTYI